MMGITNLLPRRVEPEALDSLGADAPAARRSRRDLRRLHIAMGTLSIMRRALAKDFEARPLRVLELGAGDGSMALRFASRRAAHHPPVTLTLLDRQATVSEKTLARLRAVNWTASVATADVFEWLARPSDAPWDIVIANLFVHHFQADELTRLMEAVARSATVFFCCEPHRGAVALVGSHLVGLIGAGPVTRQDAVLSVYAGFRDRELSVAWPTGGGWSLQEYSAGLFSHCFMARKV